MRTQNQKCLHKSKHTEELIINFYFFKLVIKKEKCLDCDYKNKTTKLKQNIKYIVEELELSTCTTYYPKYKKWYQTRYNTFMSGYYPRYFNTKLEAWKFIGSEKEK